MIMEDDNRPKIDFHFENGSINTIISGGTFQAAVHTNSRCGGSSRISEDQEELAEDLSSFFFGVQEEVEKFISAINGADPTDVTSRVNKLLREKKVSDKTCLKPLWEVLSKHKMYDRTYKTWTEQVVKPH